MDFCFSEYLWRLIYEHVHVVIKLKMKSFENEMFRYEQVIKCVYHTHTRAHFRTRIICQICMC